MFLNDQTLSDCISHIRSEIALEGANWHIDYAGDIVNQYTGGMDYDEACNFRDEVLSILED